MASKNQGKKQQQEEIRRAQEKLLNREKDELKAAKPRVQEIKNDRRSDGEKSLERLSFDDEDVSVREEPLSPPPQSRALNDLEASLARERIPESVRRSDYTRELSREPVQILYDQARVLAQKVEGKGYLTATEQRQFEYLTGAIEEKVDSGEYSFTEETAKKASLILQLASDARSLYREQSSTREKSWYKSG